MAPTSKPSKPIHSPKATPAPQAPSESTPAPQAPTSQKTNTMAVVAIILAFLIPFVGLILGIVALSQIKKRNEGGKGLAIASIVISSIGIVVYIIFIAMMSIFGAAIFATQSELNRQGVNIDTNNGTIDVKGKDGESASIGDAKVPSAFPSSIPIYPGSKVVASTSGKSNTEFTVFLTTTDSKSTVESYYQSELKKNGWIAEDSGSTVDLGFASGAKYLKGGQQLLVTIVQDKDNKGTAITLIVTPEVQ